MGLFPSLFYFGVPALIFSASILGLLPILVRAGYANITIFAISFCGPLLLMLIAAFIAYRVEGNAWTWTAFRDRMRLRPMDRYDWLWAAAVVALSLGGMVAIQPVAELFSSITFYAAPEEYKQFASEGFGDTNLKGRWDVFLWMFVALTVLNIGGEELWWRGVILPRQELAFGKWAWLVHGLLWNLFHAFYHTSLASVIAYLPITLPLSLVVQLRRNTWIGIISHWFINAGFFLVAIGKEVIG
jgi:membrane protease YdiL (CAAX protease family)